MDLFTVISFRVPLVRASVLGFSTNVRSTLPARAFCRRGAAGLFDEPRHKSAPIRTAEDTCPECDNEYRQNRRPLHDVSHFKRDAGLECPGCVNSGLEDDKVFRIPWNLESYFFDGVAPQQAGRFKELLDHSRVPFHVCQNQQRELHYIFPSVRSYTGVIQHLHRSPGLND